MGRKRKTAEEIRAELLMMSLNRERSPEEMLEIGRRHKEDRNIQLGNNVATGLCLIQLMIRYEMDDEWLIDFAQTLEKFYGQYESGNKDDVEEIKGLFEELEKRTGYNVLTGKVEERKEKIDEE